MKNVNAHYERLEIKRPAKAPAGFLPLWQLLAETVNQSARDKSRVRLWPVQLPAPSGTTTAIRLHC